MLNNVVRVQSEETGCGVKEKKLGGERKEEERRTSGGGNKYSS
jgi:hypothetical protein